MLDRQESALSGIVSILEHRRSDGIAAFGEVSDAMGALNAALGAVGASLHRLSDICRDHGDVEGIVALRQSLAELRTSLAAWTDAGTEERLSAALSEAQLAMDQLRREAAQLSAIASMTAITAAGAGVSGMSAYVHSLRGMTAAMHKNAQAVAERLASLGLARQAATETALKADGALRLSEASLAGEADELAETLGKSEAVRSRLDRSARALADEVAKETGALITSIQFSDSFAQRLEHVCSMLEHAGGREAAVATLAAEQLRSLAGDGHQSETDLKMALGRLERLSARAREEFRGQGLLARDLVGSLRAALADAVDSRATSAPAIEASTSAALEMRRDIEEVEQRFRSLSGTTEAINLSAINAGLMTARAEAAREALGVLSDSVRQSAGVCSVQIEACRKALSVLSGALGSRVVGEIQAAAGAFFGGLDTCSASLATAFERESGLVMAQDGVSDAAETISRIIREKGPALDAAGDVANGLQRLAEEITSRFPGRPQSWPDLEDIFATYTMSRERDVHDRLLGRSDRQDGSAPKPETSLDDILF